MITPIQEIALSRDLPESGLRAGDVAVVIDYVAHPNGGEEGAVLEVFNALGESIAVVTAPVSALTPLNGDQIPSVRQRA